MDKVIDFLTEQYRDNYIELYPDDFIEKHAVELLSQEDWFWRPIYKKYEDCANECFTDSEKVLAIKIEMEARKAVAEFDVDYLHDVRYDEASWNALQEDAWSYYGVSKSNFYGVK